MKHLKKAIRQLRGKTRSSKTKKKHGWKEFWKRYCSM